MYVMCDALYVCNCMYVIVLYCRMYGVLYGLHTSYLFGLDQA